MPICNSSSPISPPRTPNHTAICGVRSTKIKHLALLQIFVGINILHNKHFTMIRCYSFLTQNQNLSIFCFLFLIIHTGSVRQIKRINLFSEGYRRYLALGLTSLVGKWVSAFMRIYFSLFKRPTL